MSVLKKIFQITYQFRRFQYGRKLTYPVPYLSSLWLGQKAYRGTSDYRVRNLLILKPLGERSEYSQETLWQLKLRHWLSASVRASDYGLSALQPRKQANGFAQ